MARRSLVGWLVAGGAVAGLSLYAGSSFLFAGRADAATPEPRGAEPAPHPAAAGVTPILVELFTSEGCSSCPAADAVATQLERTQPVAGAQVIVLAHHVDYWNSLGWPDPWSSPAATERQRSYGHGSYTPQAIVDGMVDVVGSRESALESAIGTAAKVAHVKVDVDVLPVANDKHVFDVSVRTGPLPADGETWIAVVQDRGRVAVPRGENAGRTLDHTSIVRSLVVGAKARVTVPAPVAAPDGTTFSVIAFVQERASHKVLGAAVRPCQ